MIIEHFLKWIETARVAERATAANALARAYLQSEMSIEERCTAEAALTLLLDDPSPKVRAAMAEPLSLSTAAPIQIINALAGDQAEVAAMILVRSPLLSDSELIDRVACGGPTVQRLVAMRPQLSMQVCAAIAEIGDPVGCVEMLANPGASIAVISFRRLAERLGDDAGVRRALLNHGGLPADVRHTVLVAVGEALGQSALLQRIIGTARAERIVRDACIKACVSLIENTPQAEFAALVEHLRLRGDLTEGFVVRAVAHGKIDFLAAILVALSGQGGRRVRTLLTNGRDNALRALFRACGLSDGAHMVMLRALKVWRDVANGRRLAGVQEVSWLMLREIGGVEGSRTHPAAENDDLIALLKSLHIDQLRQNARGHALAIAAA